MTQGKEDTVPRPAPPEKFKVGQYVRHRESRALSSRRTITPQSRGSRTT